jgi:hypothetical protein
MEDLREQPNIFFGRGWFELAYLIPREMIVDKFLRQSLFYWSQNLLLQKCDAEATRGNSSKDCRALRSVADAGCQH